MACTPLRAPIQVAKELEKSLPLVVFGWNASRNASQEFFKSGYRGLGPRCGVVRYKVVGGKVYGDWTNTHTFRVLRLKFEEMLVLTASSACIGETAIAGGE